MPVSLKVAAGDSMYLAWQAQQGPLRACTALTPWGDAVTLGTAGRLTYWGAGLSQGACGVKADSLQLGRDNGTWTLVATGETTTQRYTNVTVVGEFTHLSLSLIFSFMKEEHSQICFVLTNNCQCLKTTIILFDNSYFV